MRPLKFEHSVLIGDTIRAYDFEPLPGREDAFVEGIVQETSSEFGFKAFVISCLTDSICPVGAHYSRVGKSVHVPMETSMDYDARIKVIG